MQRWQCFCSSAWPATGQDAGYTQLFNGKDLSGWVYGKGDKAEKLDGKTETADKRFEVKDGAIVANAKDKDGKGGISDLWTAKEFDKDFNLKLEFKAGEKADSGVYIRGPQLQVRDFIRRGEQKQLKNFKNDDWNELDITVKGTEATCRAQRRTARQDEGARQGPDRPASRERQVRVPQGPHQGVEERVRSSGRACRACGFASPGRLVTRNRKRRHVAIRLKRERAMFRFMRWHSPAAQPAVRRSSPPSGRPTSSSSSPTTWATATSAASAPRARHAEPRPHGRRRACASPTSTSPRPSAPRRGRRLLTGCYPNRVGILGALGPGHQDRHPRRRERPSPRC